jgi:hypothetical protein
MPVAAAKQSTTRPPKTKLPRDGVEFLCGLSEKSVAR